MDYMTYTVVVASATLTTLIMMAVWGRYCDVVGNIRVLKTSSLFVPLIPLLWLFSSNVFYLIIIQIFAGFFWAGFNLSASNFIYDAVSAPKRSRCVAYFNVVNGVAIFLGATLGGLLAGVLPAIKANRLLCLFSVSAAARAFVTYLFYNKVIEVRPRVKKVSSIELFSSIFGVNPILGVSSGTLLPYGEKGEG
jgi:MFS family permease